MENPFNDPEYDPSAKIRYAMISDEESKSREELEKLHGQVWDDKEMHKDFDYKSDWPPFVVVARKPDGVEGTLKFQDYPRYYFKFIEVKLELA